MLYQLHIENIALIEELNIEFTEGLNILTGETGAGKSIIIDSINILLGQRASKDIIRTGKEKALTEGLIYINSNVVKDRLSDIGLEINEDNSILLSREINRNGKNVCKANGRIIALSQLKETGNLLINIHGQHDSQELLDVTKHITFVDNYSGDEIKYRKTDYIKLLNKVKELKNNIDKLVSNNMERERRIDLIKFQLNEINSSNLTLGEEEEIHIQIKVLSNSEKIINSISKTYSLLYTTENGMISTYDSISEAIDVLSEVCEYDGKIEDMHKSLLDVSYQIEEISRDVCDYRDTLEYDPNLLRELQERVDVINNLKRKYGKSIEEILNYRDEILNELENISFSEDKLKRLESEYDISLKDLHKAAEEMSKIRKKYAFELQNSIENELKDLDMNKIEFNISFKHIQQGNNKKFFEDGVDVIEFLISTNLGEPLKPLAKIASGGEMSRIMLAIKNVLAGVDSAETLIFDEIDIGISGRAAQKVAEKLSKVSKKTQVLCITHLPQIASIADTHYLISKISSGNKTNTNVKRLKDKEREEEIARIIGGTRITETTLTNAKELINMAENTKKDF